MIMIYTQTGLNANISVQEKFALTLPGAKTPIAPERASTAQPSLRAHTPRLKNGIQAFSRPPTPSVSNGFRPPARSHTPSMSNGRQLSNGAILTAPVENKLQANLDKFKSWAENAISKQRKDIDRISGMVERVERGMDDFRDFMVEVRTELANRHQDIPTQEDLVAIREDLNGFRDEFATHQQVHGNVKQQELTVVRESLNGLRQKVETKLGEPKVALHDFQVLTRDVQKVHWKAVEVDDVKAELEYLRNRITFLEEGKDSLLPKELDIQPKSTLLDRALSERAPVPGLARRLQRSESLPELPGIMRPHVNDGADFDETEASVYINPQILDSEMSNEEDPLSVATKAPAKPPKEIKEIKAKQAFPVVVSDLPTTAWKYTGGRHHLVVKKVLGEFGLTYANTGVVVGVKTLEKHVNESELQNTPLAQKYGEITTTTEDGEGLSETVADLTYPSKQKRKHAQIEEAHGESITRPAKRKRGYQDDVNREVDHKNDASEHQAEIGNPAISKLQGPKPKPRRGSLNEPPRRLGRARTVSDLTITNDMPPPSTPTMALSTANNSNLSDSLGYRKRDADGNILTASGRIDRRSLRRKPRVSISGKENETPLREREVPGTDESRDASPEPAEVVEQEQTLVEKQENEQISQDTPIPSIERERDFAIVIPRMSVSDLTATAPSNLTPTPPPSVNKEKPYKCGVCGKKYKIEGHFYSVSLTTFSFEDLKEEFS
jgi:hypothetical protein